MSLELRRTQSKSTKFAGRPVIYVFSNNTDPKEASNETFQTKDILKKKHGAYWNKFEKRWEWTVFNEKDTEIALKKATEAVDEANEFLQNKAEKIAPLIKALKDIEEGIAQASSFVTRADAESVVDKLRGFIKDLQNEVDEAKFDEKIQNYLAFAASRRTFSLRNTLLLFIQRPMSKDARSKTNWSIVDRKPKPDAQSIILFRPPLRPLGADEKKKLEADFRKRMGYGPTSQMSKADYTQLQSKLKNGVPRSMNPDNFIPYSVFDITDTEPTKPGVGEEPEDLEWFNTEPNEAADRAKVALVAASNKAGVKVSIVEPKNDEILQRGAKGYSSSGNIVLSSEATGVGGFRVMAHEFAHEILHQTHLKTLAKDRKSERDQDFIDLYVGKDDKQIKELQADATAYVVLKNYNIQDDTIATYLTLFRADRQNIQTHLEVITKAANKIIQMVDSEMEGHTLSENTMKEQLNVDQVAKMLGVNTGREEMEESTDFDRYEEVVFLQGEEAEEVLEFLRKDGEEEAFAYLTQWHDPGNHMGTNQVPGDSSAQTFQKDGYTMSYDTSLGYIGLIYDMQHDGLKHQMHSMGEIPLNESLRAIVRMSLSENVFKGVADAIKGGRREKLEVGKQIYVNHPKLGKIAARIKEVLGQGKVTLNFWDPDTNSEATVSAKSGDLSLKEYSERSIEDYPWYCADCDEEKQWFDVTYEENCAQCGNHVVANEEGNDYTDMAPEDYSDMMAEMVVEMVKKKGYNYEVYHETLAGVVETIQEFLAEKGYEISDDQLFQFGIGGISYGVTKRAGFELTRQGEPAKNMLNVQVYRMDSGRYELNMYYNNSRSIKESGEWQQCNYCSNQLSPNNLVGPGQEFCGGCGASANEPGKYMDSDTEEITYASWAKPKQ